MNETKPEIWYLSISTFAGLVGGASHVTGQLYRGNKKHGGNLEYVMTRAEAADFNRFDGTLPSYHKFRAGDTSTRWAAESRLITEAIRIFNADAEPESVLLRGNPACADPQEPLAGYSEVLDTLTPIWKRWEEIDGWEGGDTKEALALEKRWDAELRRLGFE